MKGNRLEMTEKNKAKENKSKKKAFIPLKAVAIMGWVFFIGNIFGRAIAIIFTHDDVTTFAETLNRLGSEIWSNSFFVIFVIAVTIGAVLNKKEEFVSWEYKHGKDVIVVKNAGSSESLIVNGEVQDKKTGTSTPQVELKGNLPSGEEIKATLKGGFFTMGCTLLVDNKILEADDT
jgi:hypothetical protein